MNVWSRGPVTHNPYTRTAFRVARVPREVVRRRTVVQLIGQTKQLVDSDPERHRIGGRAVTPAEINAAEQILLDPGRRVLEELLEHAAEELLLDRIKALDRAAAEAMRDDDQEPLPVTNLSGLASWGSDLVEQFLDAVPGADPSLGALELRLVPPFGDPEET